ncbi:hypothetical protein IAT40_006392 [Kwoniella sp. CBS 6097]
MPPRLPIPRFTLYTGGKECSLCEVAKHELSILRRTTPFDLTLWNIRDPPEGADFKEAKKWRRLYQYDIPVLHLGEKRIQKHRIDRSKLQTFIEEWQASHAQQQQHQQQTSKPTSDDPESAGKKAFSSAPSRSSEKRRSAINRGDGDATDGDELGSQEDVEESDAKEKTGQIDIPPWKTYLGKAFFHLPSPIGEYTPESEWEIYAPLLEKTFRGFSDVPVGIDVPVIGLSESAASTLADVNQRQMELGWEIDTRPGLVGIDGEGGDVLYDEPARETARWQTNQVCWNCLETGHAFSACPHPRNQAQIRKSREDFIHTRDYLMPEQAIPTLHLYLDMRITQNEKDRRLELVDQFVPGKISAQLEDAICYIDANDKYSDNASAGIENLAQGEQEQLIRLEMEKVEVKRRRKRWDWYEGMMRWGYPPGWVAGRDPVEEVKRRISLLHVHEKPFDTVIEMGEGDDLQIFGGTLGTPTGSDHGESPDFASTNSGSGMDLSSDLDPDPEATSSITPEEGGQHVEEGGQGDTMVDMDIDMDIDLDNGEELGDESPSNTHPDEYSDPTTLASRPWKDLSPCSLLPLEDGSRPSPENAIPLPPPPSHDFFISPSLSPPRLPPADDVSRPPPSPEEDMPPPPSSDDNPPPPPIDNPPPPPDDIPTPPPPPLDEPPPPPPDEPREDGRITRLSQKLDIPIQTPRSPESQSHRNDNIKHSYTPHVYTHADAHSHASATSHQAPSLTATFQGVISENRSTSSRSIPAGPRGYHPPTPSSKSTPIGPRGSHPPTPMKRWARYRTDLFDSDRLIVYDESRPFPIGMW